MQTQGLEFEFLETQGSYGRLRVNPALKGGDCWSQSKLIGSNHISDIWVWLRDPVSVNTVEEWPGWGFPTPETYMQLHTYIHAILSFGVKCSEVNSCDPSYISRSPKFSVADINLMQNWRFERIDYYPLDYIHASHLCFHWFVRMTFEEGVIGVHMPVSLCISPSPSSACERQVAFSGNNHLSDHPKINSFSGCNGKDIGQQENSETRCHLREHARDFQWEAGIWKPSWPHTRCEMCC